MENGIADFRPQPMNVGGANVTAQPAQESPLPQGTNLTEQIYQMSPDALNAMKERYRVRNMTPLQRRQEMEQLAIDAKIQNGLNSQVNIKDPTGPTLDQFGPSDAGYLSPEAQAMQRQARREWMKEYSTAMAGMDKTAFKTPGDYQAFVNGLEATKKYGRLIEGTVFNASRKFIPPELKSKFDAHERNLGSFQDYLGKNVGMMDLDNNGVADSAAVIFDFAERGDPFAKAVVEKWRNDPYTVQYVVGPDGKIIADQTKGQRIQDMQARQQAQEQESKANQELATLNAESTAIGGPKYVPLGGRAMPIQAAEPKPYQPTPVEKFADARMSSDYNNYAQNMAQLENYLEVGDATQTIKVGGIEVNSPEKAKTLLDKLSSELAWFQDAYGDLLQAKANSGFPQFITLSEYNELWNTAKKKAKDNPGKYPGMAE